MYSVGPLLSKHNSLLENRHRYIMLYGNMRRFIHAFGDESLCWVRSFIPAT